MIGLKRWDADRFGIIDADGEFITPNELLASP
jgi:phosphomannomutase